MTEPNPDPRVETQGAAPEPLEFLVGSWNRFEVLNSLDSTALTRRDLRERTGVSRPTLSRILSDLVDRGWVRRRNNEYEATHIGRVVADEVDTVIANIDTALALDEAVEWVPTDELGFDLAHLATAQILTPTPQDHTRPMRRLADRIEATEEMRIVATGVTFEVVKALGEACVAGELQIRCILDERAVAGVRDEPELATLWSEMVERGNCEPYRYVGDDELLDYNVLDDAAMFCGISDEGLPKGILVSDDDTVRSWAAFRFEQMLEDAEPLGPDAFTP